MAKLYQIFIFTLRNIKKSFIGLIKLILKINNFYSILHIYIKHIKTNKDFIILFRNKLKIKCNYNVIDIFMFIENFITQVYLKQGITIKKGDIVFDLGANKGFFSVLASKLVGKQGKIICFEPNPKVLNYFSENISVNNIKNVILYDKGAFYKNITLKFGLSDSEDGSSSLVDNGVKKDRYIEIECIDINKIICEFDTINLIKCDIEGAEYELFRNISDENFNKIKQISFEIHKITGESIPEFINFLEKKGFLVIHKDEALYCKKK